MDVEEVDLLVIGGGKAGKSLAMDRAKAGQKVAMVERAMIGGTCINVACIPTKTLINSGRVLETVRRAEEFGISGVEDPRMDLALLRHRKDDVVGTMVKGQLTSFIDSSMDFVLGEAKFTGPRTVHVDLNDGGTRVLRGTDVVINLGTEPALPPIAGLAEARVQTSNTLLELESLPESIVILGGGYIGCEFADLLNTIGVDVTIVQRGNQLLGREDEDVSAAVKKAFIDAGITVRLGAAAEKIQRAADGTVTITLDDGETVSAGDVLVALGRKPMTDGAKLEATGVVLDDRGFIEVDQQLRVGDGVWAAGDAAGTPQFTHASYDDYRILKANLAARHGDGEARTTAGRLIPYTVFITPELGRVGLTEQQAREAGHDVRIAKMPVAAIPRARTLGQTEGVWKAVLDRKTGRILGVALLGTEASEAIAVVQMAMLAGLDFTAVRDAVITHPTIAEGLNLLFTRAYLED
ncbi:dihydrolipoyl dehydrogenase family protein [Arthrobacter sp. VKM Ac-2550]|uniref:dihydrolipoyl dehydrogenase family protein n=1 Tax=Crystallibacter permensis TaxID=1938888 RepID=UPI002225EB73|nr:FAD-dependent oxidoreductase [Arthrobacter sp. VKM Ac-2550]MCW2134075.1 Pyruvate/2-oxoglutarate dehydrogenase complex, dihydrolipoamide dehydrogenase (E3) component [Arthrobacter sp. VKM Ac-2550]